jgi:hypothetical protein
MSRSARLTIIAETSAVPPDLPARLAHETWHFYPHHSFVPRDFDLDRIASHHA